MKGCHICRGETKFVSDKQLKVGDFIAYIKEHTLIIKTVVDGMYPDAQIFRFTTLMLDKCPFCEEDLPL